MVVKAVGQMDKKKRKIAYSLPTKPLKAYRINKARLSQNKFKDAIDTEKESGVRFNSYHPDRDSKGKPMASYRDKHDAAEKANKDFQLTSGADHSFAESEEFKASYIEGLNMAEQSEKQAKIFGHSNEVNE